MTSRLLEVTFLLIVENVVRERDESAGERLRYDYDVSFVVEDADGEGF
jgi:hypothetical protein